MLLRPSAGAKFLEFSAQTLAEGPRRRVGAKVDEFAREYAGADRTAIVDYFRVVLENSDYPGSFPKVVKIAYVPESKQLVVQYDCPTLDVVPEIAAFKFVKSKSQVTSTQRPAGQRRALYASVIAQTVVRTLHEILTADAQGYVDSIVFNGHVTAIDTC